jgi:hypothetical protein
MPQKFVAPTTTAKSFSCPHCGALADQRWFKIYANSEDSEDKLPKIAALQLRLRPKDLQLVAG